MRTVPRKFALLAVCAAALACSTGCSDVKKKIVGKWKLVSVTEKSGKESSEGKDMVWEFTAGGELNLVLEGKADDKAEAPKDGKDGKSVPLGTYKISGDKIELTPSEFGKLLFTAEPKGRVKITGETLTITDDKMVMKFTRAN